MIRFDDISKEFQVQSGTIRALDKVSFEISQGAMFGLLGKSGAGKSTLLRCINLLERPTSG